MISFARIGQSVRIGNTTVPKAVATLAIAGSFAFSGNLIGLGVYSSFMNKTHAVLTPVEAKDTGSGGLTLAGADTTYDTILAPSPYRSGSEARSGLKSGTGVVWDAVLAIIANPNGVSVDCTKVGPGTKNATGGTLIFNNVSITGSTIPYNTPFVLGPAESVKCATRGNPGRLFSGSLLLRMSDSPVIN